MPSNMQAKQNIKYQKLGAHLRKKLIDVLALFRGTIDKFFQEGHLFSCDANIKNVLKAKTVEDVEDFIRKISTVSWRYDVINLMLNHFGRSKNNKEKILYKLHIAENCYKSTDEIPQLPLPPKSKGFAFENRKRNLKNSTQLNRKCPKQASGSNSVQIRETTIDDIDSEMKSSEEVEILDSSDESTCTIEESKDTDVEEAIQASDQEIEDEENFADFQAGVETCCFFSCNH